MAGTSHKLCFPPHWKTIRHGCYYVCCDTCKSLKNVSFMCYSKHTQNTGVQLKVVYRSSIEWPNLVTCLTDTHSEPTFCISTYLYVRILYKPRWSINIFLVLTQQFKKMIANRLNVRPVKVKLPPGATHAYVTFRYSVPLILIYHLNVLVETILCVHRAWN